MSPSLFNIVMDPLLVDLNSKELGLSIHGLFLGTLAHAHDVCTTSTNPEDATEQFMSLLLKEMA